MNLIRRYKISKLTNTPLKKEELERIDFFDSFFNNLKSYKRNENSNSIFYMNSKGKYIFEYEKSNYEGNSILWIRCDIVSHTTVQNINSVDRCIIDYFIKKYYNLEYSNIFIVNNTDVIKLIENEFSEKI